MVVQREKSVFCSLLYLPHAPLARASRRAARLEQRDEVAVLLQLRGRGRLGASHGRLRVFFSHAVLGDSQRRGGSSVERKVW